MQLEEKITVSPEIVLQGIENREIFQIQFFQLVKLFFLEITNQ